MKFGTRHLNIMLLNICEFRKNRRREVRTAFCVDVDEITFPGVPWNLTVPGT